MYYVYNILCKICLIWIAQGMLIRSLQYVFSLDNLSFMYLKCMAAILASFEMFVSLAQIVKWSTHNCFYIIIDKDHILLSIKWSKLFRSKIGICWFPWYRFLVPLFVTGQQLSICLLGVRSNMGLPLWFPQNRGIFPNTPVIYKSTQGSTRQSRSQVNRVFRT